MVLIDSWPYDLMVTGEVSFESEVTNFPVERGSNISDHIRPNPITLTLEVIVSDTPIGALANDPSRQVQERQPDGLAILGINVADILGTDQVPLPSAEAYERLRGIRDSRRLVQIEIPVGSRKGKPGKRLYQNMALTNLSERHGADTTGAGMFSVSFQQVAIVENRKIFVRTAAPTGQPKAKSKSLTTKDFITDDGVLWEMATPAGGVLKGGEPWAMVFIKKATATGGPLKFFFTGEHSKNVKFKITPSQELTPAQAIDFQRDRLRKSLVKEKGTFDGLNSYNEEGVLPKDFNLDKFTAPVGTAPVDPSVALF